MPHNMELSPEAHRADWTGEGFNICMCKQVGLKVIFDFERPSTNVTFMTSTSRDDDLWANADVGFFMLREYTTHLEKEGLSQ